MGECWAEEVSLILSPDQMLGVTQGPKSNGQFRESPDYVVSLLQTRENGKS